MLVESIKLLLIKIVFLYIEYRFAAINNANDPTLDRIRTIIIAFFKNYSRKKDFQKSSK